MSRAAQVARQFVQYHQRVLATDPIAYWVQDEKSGAVAYDLVSGRVAGAQNGAYTGVTLGQDGIGDGRTSPYYGGANDYTNIHSATLAGAFNSSTGTALIWFRIGAAGVWTDGNQRNALTLVVDGANGIQIFKDGNANLMACRYRAGGVTKNVVIPSGGTLDWIHIGLTWNKPADEMRPYYNGTQFGATQNGLGVWAGNLAAAFTNIGCYQTIPNFVTNGYIAHVAVWGRVLAAEIADLAVVE